MVERSQNSYPLLRQFREFYAEVARLRAIVERAGSAGEWNSEFTADQSGESQTVAETGAIQSSASSTILVDKPADASAFGRNLDPTTVRVWREMAAYLDQKMYEVKLAVSALSHDYLEEMVYIMAAFADETFVCLLDWPGKDYWRDHLMELRLFHSQMAGQDIFRRIEKSLVRQDYGVEELAIIHLMILALGFKGQYLRDPAAVELYRRKLFDRLAMTKPELRRESQRLFPEAYRHTVTEGAPVRLPEPGTWWLIVAGILGSWLLLSTITWLLLITPTRQQLALTMKSLDRVINREIVAPATDKWTTLPFSLQSGAFRAQLPASLPLAKGASGAVVAPFLVGVVGFGGQAAGPAPQVAEWLSRGTTAVTSTTAGTPPRSQVVASAEPIQTPPGGITATSGTLFFMVDTGVGAQQLGSQPQLSFSIDGGYGIAVDGVTLYLPAQPVAAAQ
jgi:type IV/VI secretion system ImpK/VasF family protein